MRCQRRSRISANTGGIRRCGFKRISIPDPNEYKYKTKYQNSVIWKLSGLNPHGMLKIELVRSTPPNCWPLKMVRWICRNGTDVRDYVPIPKISAICVIVSWRPLSFGWRPFHGLHPQWHFQSYTHGIEAKLNLFNISVKRCPFLRLESMCV